MNNGETNITTITSLVVDNEPSNPQRPSHTPPWHAPFLEILGLLKIIDNSRPTPKVEDQRLCFQPSHDLTEISRIFLSVSTSDFQYDVDLKTIRVVGSDTVPQAVAKLQEYADNVLRRNRQLRDRLLEHDMIEDPTIFLRVDMFTCPVCHDSLIGCLQCNVEVACSNPACLTTYFAGCEHCFEHHRVVCFECLRQNDTTAPLIYCPMCRNWCCREDSVWCLGLVIQPALGSQELARLSHDCDWDSETIVRSHLPKHSPCRACIGHDFAPAGWGPCRSSMNDMRHDRCPSQTPFMIENGLRAAYCPDCLESSPGRVCACRLGWLCDMCFALGNTSADYRFFITCPRCGVSYCTGPSHSCGDSIDFCWGCKGVILCNDCQEQEELPGGSQIHQGLPNEVVFVERCSFCESWSCEACSVSHGTARCFHCDEWFCRLCVSYPPGDVLLPCPFCSGPVCPNCRREHRNCEGGIMTPPHISPFLGDWVSVGRDSPP